MRRIAFAVTAALTALVVGGTPGAVAGGSPIVATTSLVTADVQSLTGNQGADVFGVGGGKTEGAQTLKFNLSAHEGPDGDFGHVGVTYFDALGNVIVSYSTDVICVHIHTLTSTTFDRGVIKGVITKITPVPNPLLLDVGDVVDFGIEDGGNPSSVTPVDDFYAPGSPGIPPEDSCKLFTYTGFLHNVTQGNVNIKGP
jgi:hypothetical protein